MCMHFDGCVFVFSSQPVHDFPRRLADSLLSAFKWCHLYVCKYAFILGEQFDRFQNSELANSKSRMTRLGEFPPIGRIVYFGKFEIYIRHPNFWTTSFRGKRYVLTLTKIGLGYVFEIFSQTHPVTLSKRFSQRDTTPLNSQSSEVGKDSRTKLRHRRRKVS
jgi:hypothetical protein